MISQSRRCDILAGPAPTAAPPATGTTDPPLKLPGPRAPTTSRTVDRVVAAHKAQYDRCRREELARGLDFPKPATGSSRSTVTLSFTGAP